MTPTFALLHGTRGYWAIVGMACAVMAWSCQPAFAFGVSPAIIQFDADPGTAKTAHIVITNSSPTIELYDVTVKNFVPQGEDGQQLFLDDGQAADLASWISIQNQSFSLEPGQTTSVIWTVNVPTDAAPGGHYAAVFFQTSLTAGEVKTMARTGVLFLVNVRGVIHEEASVAAFDVTAPCQEPCRPQDLAFDHLPLKFIIKILNKGSVHIAPKGEIVLTNALGMEVSRLPFNQQDAYALPNSARRYVLTWGPENSAPKNGFFANLQAEIRGFGMGPYHASFEATYGSEPKILMAETTFWIFPWRTAVMVGLLILMAIVLRYSVMIHAYRTTAPAVPEKTARPRTRSKQKKSV